MIHTHKLEIQIPALLAKPRFKIPYKWDWQQLAIVISRAVRWRCLKEAADHREMPSEGRRGFLREFPWDEQGRWRREDNKVLTGGYEELAL